jgi:hypothetical protein
MTSLRSWPLVLIQRVLNDDLVLFADGTLLIFFSLLTLILSIYSTSCIRLLRPSVI